MTRMIIQCIEVGRIVVSVMGRVYHTTYQYLDIVPNTSGAGAR